MKTLSTQIRDLAQELAFPHLLSSKKLMHKIALAQRFLVATPGRFLNAPQQLALALDDLAAEIEAAAGLPK